MSLFRNKVSKDESNKDESNKEKNDLEIIKKKINDYDRRRKIYAPLYSVGP